MCCHVIVSSYLTYLSFVDIVLCDFDMNYINDNEGKKNYKNLLRYKLTDCSKHYIYFWKVLTTGSIIIIQFWSGFIHVNAGGRIYPTLTAISPTPTLHLARLKISSFSKPTLLLSFSTCVFHLFFGRPRFLLHFTSNSNTFLITCPSSLLNTCPYHLTPFTWHLNHCFLRVFGNVQSSVILTM